MGLTFGWEPFGGALTDDVSDPAEVATAGLVRVAVEEADGHATVLTHLEDVEARSTRDEVHAPAVFVAERLVGLWGPAFYGWRPRPRAEASPRERHRWRRAHLLSLVGGGVPLPRIELERIGEDELRVRALLDRPDEDGARVRFLHGFDGTVALRPSRESVRGFVASVVARLRHRCPDSPRLAALVDAWSEATDPRHPGHRAYRRLAALGECPRGADPALRARLAGIEGDDALVEAALALSTPETWEEHLAPSLRLAQELRSARRDPQAEARSELRSALARDRGTPAAEPAWRTGWRQAEAVRRVLRDEAPRLDRLQARGVEVATLDYGASLVMRREDGTARRLTGARPSAFQRLRDLHPILFGADDEVVTGFGPTEPGRASVANAFAAEWIAPIAHVRAEVAGRRVLDLDDLAAVARGLGAPLPVVRHQIENHALAVVE